MNATQQTIKLLKELSEDQLIELFREIDCEETAVLVYEAANFYLREKAEQNDPFLEPSCEQEWMHRDYQRRYLDAI